MAASCHAATTVRVRFETRPDYIIDLSDGHSYQRDTGDTESYGAESRMLPNGHRDFIRFHPGETAYVCTNVEGRPASEIEIVEAPHVFDYSGRFVYHKLH